MYLVQLLLHLIQSSRWLSAGTGAGAVATCLLWFAFGPGYQHFQYPLGTPIDRATGRTALVSLFCDSIAELKVHWIDLSVLTSKGRQVLEKPS